MHFFSKTPPLTRIPKWLENLHVIILANVCLLAVLSATPVPTQLDTAIAAPQGSRANQPNPSSSLGGSTPEPTMLLLGGVALAYGAVRRRKRRAAASHQ